MSLKIAKSKRKKHRSKTGLMKDKDYPWSRICVKTSLRNGSSSQLPKTDHSITATETTMKMLAMAKTLMSMVSTFQRSLMKRMSGQLMIKVQIFKKEIVAIISRVVSSKKVSKIGSKLATNSLGDSP